MKSISDLACFARQFKSYLVYGHQFLGSVLRIPVKWCKLDLFRVLAHVSERSLDSVQIMRADSNELPHSTKILVKLVLKINERFVFELVHGSGKTKNG